MTPEEIAARIVNDSLAACSETEMERLIAAAIQAAIEKERAECAKIAMSYRTDGYEEYEAGKDVAAGAIAEEIQSRK